MSDETERWNRHLWRSRNLNFRSPTMMNSLLKTFLKIIFVDFTLCWWNHCNFLEIRPRQPCWCSLSPVFNKLIVHIYLSLAHYLQQTWTYACVSRCKKCSFLENLACFFLLPPFWDSNFCLITDDSSTLASWETQ